MRLFACKANNKRKNAVITAATSPNSMDPILQSMYFRKVFYLASIIALILLLVIKYTLIPVIDRREAQPKKILRYILDTLIGVLIAAMAVGGAVFWMSGNE